MSETAAVYETGNTMTFPGTFKGMSIEIANTADGKTELVFRLIIDPVADPVPTQQNTPPTKHPELENPAAIEAEQQEETADLSAAQSLIDGNYSSFRWAIQKWLPNVKLSPHGDGYIPSGHTWEELTQPEADRLAYLLDNHSKGVNGLPCHCCKEIARTEGKGSIGALTQNRVRDLKLTFQAVPIGIAIDEWREKTMGSASLKGWTDDAKCVAYLSSLHDDTVVDKLLARADTIAKGTGGTDEVTE